MFEIILSMGQKFIIFLLDKSNWDFSGEQLICIIYSLLQILPLQNYKIAQSMLWQSIKGAHSYWIKLNNPGKLGWKILNTTSIERTFSYLSPISKSLTSFPKSIFVYSFVIVLSDCNRIIFSFLVNMNKIYLQNVHLSQKLML